MAAQVASGINNKKFIQINFAGLSSEEKLHGVKYIIESFVGCIRNVVLSSGKAASDLLPITPLIATKHENVKEGCINKCHTRENLCFVGSRCINHYYELSCDCFGTFYEGEQCDIYSKLLKPPPFLVPQTSYAPYLHFVDHLKHLNITYPPVCCTNSSGHVELSQLAFIVVETIHVMHVKG